MYISIIDTLLEHVHVSTIVVCILQEHLRVYVSISFKILVKEKI